MSERVIEQIEANSLEEARRKIDTNELIVLEVSPLSQGRVETIEAVADTVEEAFVKAQSKVPAGAKIEQKIKVVPKQVTLQVQGDNEESAGKGKAEAITSVSLLKKGRKGLWGLGRTPNVYEVVISQQAVVELRFREQAKFQAKVRDYLPEDLSQTIQEIRQRNAPWTETLELLNPKNDSDIQKWLMKLQALNAPSVLDTIEDSIEDVCRKNEKATWKEVIEEAYAKVEAEIKRQEEAEKEARRQARIAQERRLAEIEAEKKRQEEALKEAQRQAAIARARELKEREMRLRKLDHQLAEELRIYIEIYWTKDYSELKGIPRFDYVGPYRSPDPKDKQNIPRYSSDEKAFCRLLNRVESLVGLYSQVLEDEGLSEATASLEQKCLALLEAQRRRRKK